MLIYQTKAIIFPNQKFRKMGHIKYNANMHLFHMHYFTPFVFVIIEIGGTIFS